MENQNISINDFAKLDLRVGVVREAERIPNTRLIKLIVDLGELGTRQLVAGLGEWYKPDELIGKRIIVVANLEPKRIRGILSQGMLLAAGCKDDVRSGRVRRPVLLTVNEDVSPGTKIC